MSQRFAVLVFLFLSAPGCATILASKHRTIPFRSEPTGAEVSIDGQAVGKAPVQVKLKNGQDYRVTFRLAGYPDQAHVMRNKTDAGWIVLDILFGVIPIAIDAGTGAWRELRDYVVTADMTSGVRNQDVQPIAVSTAPLEPKAGLLRVTMNDWTQVYVRRAEPGSFDTVKLTFEDGSEKYVDAFAILSVMSPDGTALHRRLLADRKAIP